MALALALVSVVLCPVLLFIQFTAWFGAAMIAYEQANPMWVKVLSFAVVALIALVAFALPLLAVRTGWRARAAARSTGAGGSGPASAAVVIGTVVAVGVLVVQVLSLVSSFG